MQSPSGTQIFNEKWGNLETSKQTCLSAEFVISRNPEGAWRVSSTKGRGRSKTNLSMPTIGEAARADHVSPDFRLTSGGRDFRSSHVRAKSLRLPSTSASASSAGASSDSSNLLDPSQGTKHRRKNAFSLAIPFIYINVDLQKRYVTERITHKRIKTCIA